MTSHQILKNRFEATILERVYFIPLRREGEHTLLHFFGLEDPFHIQVLMV